ncbi:hypothetical protein PV408_21075 [Streptomyces sp. ME18-1-4]|nr:hypothetical protein [Streptomyces sp. ME18-1-4]MDX3244239.1 hypothetical protein [Streptomyces sp. ME18-1-4]
MLTSLLAFLGACTLVAASPGPSTVLIVKQSLRSRRSGFLTVLGNETGVFVWGVVAVFALSFLPQFVPQDAPHLPTMVGLAALWALYEVGYRTLAQCSTLQGGGVGHSHPSGPEGRSATVKVALSDNVVGGPTAGLAGRQACGDLVRPPSGGRGR